MGKNEPDKQPLASALRMFGAIRIWASIVFGILVAVACATVYVLSYTWQSGYVEALGEVTEVDCGAVQKRTQCTQAGRVNTCITTEHVTCDIKVNYDGDRTAPFKLDYEEGHEPSVGDRFPLFFDRDNPEEVRRHIFTERSRNIARVACGIGGAIAIVVVVVNLVLVKNKSFRLLQGGLGVVGQM